MTTTKWLLNNEIYDPLYEDIEAAGFIYRITNLESGMQYIGKKVFHARRTLPALKGKKRKRKVVKESDWRTYKSSSEDVKADIEVLGEDSFCFEIISLHVNRVEVNYHELKLQVMLDVLEARDSHGERIFYNRNINRRYYPSALHWQERKSIDEEYKNLLIR
jgi:hypothetical protein